MKVCTCFLLFLIFAYTNSSPRTTSEVYDGVDLDRKLYVGKNAKNISDKRTIGDNKISRRDSGSPSVEIFTDFIQEVIKTLNTYDDETFKDFITILDKEIEKYHYKGYKYHELMKNDEFRSFIDEKFNSIVGKPVSFVKDNINEVAENIKHKRYYNNLKKLLNLINSMYREDHREKFQKALKDLKEFDKAKHGKSKNELVEVIRHGIWAIVFKPYTNLSDKEKTELQKEITVYLKRYTETQSPKFKTKDEPAVSELTTNILNPKNITTKVFKPVTVKNMDLTSTTVQITTQNARRNIQRSKKKEELYENEKTAIETSPEESDSQQLILTFKSTAESSDETTEGSSSETNTDTSDETAPESLSELSRVQHRKLYAQQYDTLYIEDFYKTTEEPAIYKPVMDIKVVEGTSTEEASDSLPATRPKYKARQRYRTSSYPAQKKKIVSRNAYGFLRSRTTSRLLSDNDQNNLKYRDLRRSIAPPMPEEELSIEVFEREKKKREKSFAKNYSFVRNNSIQHGLKDYVKRRRNLKKKINELKKLYENIERSKLNVTTYKGDDIKITKDDYKIQDKYKWQPIEGGKDKTAVIEKQSNTHNARAQTEKNEIKEEDTQGVVEKSNLSNKDLEDTDKETVKSDDRYTLKKKKTKTVKLKETTKSTDTENTDIEYKYSTKPVTTKLYDLKSLKIPVFIELLTTAKKKQDVTEMTRVTKKIANEI